jgi:hypothetical protein
MPPNDRFRLDDGKDLQDRRKPTVKLDQKKPIEVRETNRPHAWRRSTIT